MDKVMHFEIPAKNIGRAKEFYKQTFRWEFKDVPEMEYTMAHTARVNNEGMIQELGAINGGLMKRKGKLKNPIITIEVDNLEQAFDRVNQNGGRVIVGKMSVGDMGYSAYVEDTEGNIIGLWQNAKK